MYDKTSLILEEANQLKILAEKTSVRISRLEKMLEFFNEHAKYFTSRNIDYSFIGFENNMFLSELLNNLEKNNITEIFSYPHFTDRNGKPYYIEDFNNPKVIKNEFSQSLVIPKKYNRVNDEEIYIDIFPLISRSEVRYG